MRLVIGKILYSLDFIDFDFCVGYIKGKHTNKKWFESSTTSNVFKLIHVDIFEPFHVASLKSKQYFMMSINIFSRYGCIYLLYEKSHSFDLFKNFKAKVKNWLSKIIKRTKFKNSKQFLSLDKFWQIWPSKINFNHIPNTNFDS